MVQFSTSIITADLKMSEAIMQNSYMMLLLEHFDIAVPLHDKTVEQICSEKNLNVELFLTFANLYNGLNYNSKQGFTTRDLEHIVAYLRNSHQYYSNEMYPNILTIIRDMGEINQFSEMRMVARFFEEYFNEVTEHLDYENSTVFPYILNLITSIDSHEVFDNQIDYSVADYKEHHDDIEEKLDDLKNLIIKYLPLQGDTALRRRLLFSLFELEFDLNIHSKIEENILIPLVSKMETLLNQRK